VDKKKKIRIADIIEESIVDGPGIRIAIFMQGCLHHCYKCHNQGTWDMNGGREISLEEIEDVFVRNSFTDGLTMTGGDPFYQIEALKDIVVLAKQKYKLDIIVYTGFTFEQLLDMAKNDDNVKEILNNVDTIIDGLFVNDLRDLTLRYRGSSNQRIIDVKESLVSKSIVLKSL